MIAQTTTRPIVAVLTPKGRIRGILVALEQRWEGFDAEQRARALELVDQLAAGLRAERARQADAHHPPPWRRRRHRGSPPQQQPRGGPGGAAASALGLAIMHRGRRGCSLPSLAAAVPERTSTMTTDHPIADLDAILTSEDWRNVAVLCTAAGAGLPDDRVADVVARATMPEDLAFEEAEGHLLSLLDSGLDRLVGAHLLRLPDDRKLAGVLVGLCYAQGMRAADFARLRACRAAAAA
jgi:hypothetical protein